jgi:PadR family transcriptional regulator PadR
MRGKIRAQLLKGTTTLLVLTVLRDGELYGYEIAQRIRERSGGSLYPALHALEADGALETSWRESDRGPRRRYYKITKSGLAMLEEHAQEWAASSLSTGKAMGEANR